ncbi:MAG TPA: hypothetical protein VFX97_01615 [Pyrinomonadaceae bacterium]|nr:hypothetical protein [Pyrinomonadaceae bacterium]
MFLLNSFQDFSFGDEIEEPFEMADGIYLAWTSPFIESLISDRMKLAIGGLEYLDLIERQIAVFTRGIADESLEPLQILSIWHNSLLEFVFSLWLIKDNSINIGLGFLFSVDPSGKEIGSSNSRASLYTLANGCRHPEKFTRCELLQARGLYERLHRIGARTTRPSTLNPVEQVQPSGTIISADEVRALSRATFFADSARDCTDLSVKISHYMTCLEVLFSTGSSEIVHKLAERIALFLGGNYEERRLLFNRVKKLYNIRSKVVHGDVMGSTAARTLADVSRDADSLVREVLRRIIDSTELLDLFEGDKTTREDYFIDLVLRR